MQVQSSLFIILYKPNCFIRVVLARFLICPAKVIVYYLQKQWYMNFRWQDIAIQARDLKHTINSSGLSDETI